MSVDRFGKPIIIGWADFELEYINAALTLPKAERIAAYADIAFMTGRSIRHVQRKCLDVAYKRNQSLMAAARIKPRPVARVETVQGSFIKPLDKKQLMAG